MAEPLGEAELDFQRAWLIQPGASDWTGQERELLEMQRRLLATLDAARAENKRAALAILDMARAASKVMAERDAKEAEIVLANKMLDRLATR